MFIIIERREKMEETKVVETEETKETIKEYLPAGLSARKYEDYIIEALKNYSKMSSKN